MSNDDKPKTPKDTHYAKLRRAHRDQKAGGAPAFRPRQPLPPGDNAADGLVRLYGLHTVRAALDNPRRRIRKILVTRNAAERLAIADLAALPFKAELAEPKDIDRITGSDAVHQGVLIEAEPLKPKRLDALGETRLVLVLDQVTDPHNVGAILRSAAAFGCAAVIATQRHAPPETGALAKAASGGLEQVALLRVGNLAQALQKLKAEGFWCLGLAAEGAEPLAKADLSGRIAFVLGAEGAGLRRLTREHCDLLVRLPTRPGLIQLNVSNAAALALYERARSSSLEPREPDEA
jgi:23S rRNA (guanosine2251-2'-O)-methyltransferase